MERRSRDEGSRLGVRATREGCTVLFHTAMPAANDPITGDAHARRWRTARSERTRSVIRGRRTAAHRRTRRNPRYASSASLANRIERRDREPLVAAATPAANDAPSDARARRSATTWKGTRGCRHVGTLVRGRFTDRSPSPSSPPNDARDRRTRRDAAGASQRKVAVSAPA
jgi:hypothetical protein